jgi:hypothetical protein
MAAQSANTATFSYGTAVGELLGINDFTINQTAIDTTNLATASRTFIAGKNATTFTVEVQWSHTDHATVTGDALNGGTGNVTIDFGDGQVACTAFPTSVAITAAMDDTVKATISFQATGVITITA